MYRILVMFPKSADSAQVDSLADGIAAAFRKSGGLRSLSTSVGPLMGPGGKAGEVGRIVEADLATLEDAMNVLHDADFHEVKNTTESLGSTIFMFECGDV